MHGYLNNKYDIDMKYVKLLEQFEQDLLEYRSPNHNLYKVANSNTEVKGKAIFTDNSANYDKTMKKIDDDLKSYEKHMEEAKEKMKEWRSETAKKGDLDWYAKAEKTREEAYSIVKKAAEFMKEFNSLYKELIPDLTGTDHNKVGKAIAKLLDIYPYELINQAGKLKRLKKMKYDSQFVNDVLKWTNSIMNRYEVLKQGGKYLGKSDSQIEGMRKQSAMMRARWGEF